MSSLQQQNVGGPLGSLAGEGAVDHDQSHRFGWRPRASAPYAFHCRGWRLRMDEAERLMDIFRSRATSSVASKLDALMDLERLRDPRIVPFLVELLADQREPTEVRIHILKRLRNRSFIRGFIPGYRPPVADAIRQVLSGHSSADLRLHAALALAEFTDTAGVLATLGELAVDRSESIDLRYFAFTSLQRAGPTTECVALLRQLSTDETLGRSARGVLSSWHLE